MQHFLPLQCDFVVGAIAEDEHARLLPHLNRQHDMTRRPIDGYLLIQFFLLYLALHFIIVLEARDVFVYYNIPRPLQMIRLRYRIMVGNPALNFIYYLML